MRNADHEREPLSTFTQNASDFVRRLRKTGQPVVLTIDGRPELIVQDAESYERLVVLAERGEQLERTRQSLAELDRGQTTPAEEMLAEMRRALGETLER